VLVDFFGTMTMPDVSGGFQMINIPALSKTEQKDTAEKTLVFRRQNEIDFGLFPA